MLSVLVMGPGLAWFHVSGLSLSSVGHHYWEDTEISFPDQGHRLHVKDSGGATAEQTGYNNENHTELKEVDRKESGIRTWESHNICIVPFINGRKEEESWFSYLIHIFTLNWQLLLRGVFQFSLWSFLGNLIYLWDYSNVLESNG